MNFIGIDPGLKGGIAVLFLPSGEYRAAEMPIKLQHLDIQNVWNAMPADIKNSFCVIEQLLEMPYQGVKATTKSAVNYGKVLAVLELMGISYQIVHPSKWKKQFQLIGKSKYESAAVAKRLFPNMEFVTARGRLMDGMAEALLLAEYARRIYK